MTNNPKKVRALEADGIEIVDRIPHEMPVNEHNLEYLRTKAAKSGHLLHLPDEQREMEPDPASEPAADPQTPV